MKDSHSNGFCERRSYRRSLIDQGNVFAILGPYPNTVGRVLDISRSGLSLECLSEDVKNDNPTEVSLFLINGDRFVQGLKCQKVYIRDADRPDFSSIATKRIGLQFQALDASRLHLLASIFNLNA